MKHHASHTRTAHHHKGVGHHHHDVSHQHKAHRQEHIEGQMHTAHSEPRHHEGGACNYPSAKGEPPHNK